MIADRSFQGSGAALALLLAITLAAALVALPTTARAQDGEAPPNLVANPDFADGIASWWGLDNADVDPDARQACIDFPADGAQFGNYTDLGLVEGETYTFGFTAWGTPGAEGLAAYVETDGGAVRDLAETFDVTPEPQDFRWTFTASEAQRLQFAQGDADAHTFCLTDVIVTPVAELLGNPTFQPQGDGFAPWWSAGTELTDTDGVACAAVPAGGDPWSVIVGQDGFDVEEGRTYTVAVAASAQPEANARIVIPEPGVDYPNIYEATITLRADGQGFSDTFVSEHTGTTKFQIQLGANDAPFEVCLTQASLTTGGTVETYEPDTGPRVRVNQVGYLPQGPKRATLVTDAAEALTWELQDASGALVATGESQPQGTDPSAGLNVHTIDFSAVTATGEEFTLVADGETSYPFDISETLYSQLRRDALGIYYSQRSGIEIDDAIKPGYGRPAGHVSPFGGDDVNQGDVDVPCLPNERFQYAGNTQRGGIDHYGPEGWDCPEGYTLDLTGGWYDAGDHGKYVVNSGISVWQLLNIYERNQLAEVADRTALEDGTLAIPEADNGVPDVLDEARWNLEWMLRMQVPADTPMGIGGETIDAGGLVHHKLHDIAWTGLNTFPHEDPMLRFVHRPSTAATLNLAAAAAQGARLYDAYDEDFAAELLAAARTAWDAASAHPDILAPDTNAVDPNPGGGPYNDDDVSDEFYWAAAQLFLTTGEAAYRDAVLDSPHHTSAWDPTVAFDWGHVAAAARLDLALVPNRLPARPQVIRWVLEGAQQYLAIQAEQPFGHPYGPEAYDWGSTHQVINNAVVIASAYDLTGDQRYLDGAIEAMDYVLGRNALNNSYVTAYGTHYSENMHSRWYAHSLTDRMPPPPPGKVAGGPNSGIQDPVAQANLQGCAPQMCYIDHIDSWSTNETTINWNAALAWHVSWLDDVGDGQPDHDGRPPRPPTGPPTGGPGEGPGEGPGQGPDTPLPVAQVMTADGATRIETAVLLSRLAFPDGAEGAVVARADDYADALAAVPLAAAVHGPVLLTETAGPSDLLRDELARLGVTDVTVVGGTAAVSEAAVAALAADGVSVTRLSGPDRFATAVAIADRTAELVTVTTGVVVQGDHPDALLGWPDALCGGPLAAAGGGVIVPVLTDQVPAVVSDLLDRSELELTVLGGTAAVSDAVQQALAADRIAGSHRFATCAAAADAALAAGATTDRLYVATGGGFPDALGAGAAAAANGQTLVLVDGQADTQPQPGALDFISRNDIAEIVVAGGEAAVSATVRDQLEQALED